MNLFSIVKQIKQYCPSFASRVAGAALLADLKNKNAFPVPSAFVVPGDDDAADSISVNDIAQPLTESFYVIVFISNIADEKGEEAALNAVYSIRSELWGALLGFQPDNPEGKDGGNSRYINGVYYQGFSITEINRARLCVQFDFAANMHILSIDSWQYRLLNGFPHFDGLNVKTNFIDPAFDQNIVSIGSNGQIESTITIPTTGNFP